MLSMLACTRVCAHHAPTQHACARCDCARVLLHSVVALSVFCAQGACSSVCWRSVCVQSMCWHAQRVARITCWHGLYAAGLALCWRTWCTTQSHARSTTMMGECDAGLHRACFGGGGQGVLSVLLCAIVHICCRFWSHARTAMMTGEHAPSECAARQCLWLVSCPWRGLPLAFLV